MNPLGTTLSRTPPGEELAFLCGVLLLGLGGVGALCALERREDLVRRTARILVAVGVAEFLLGIAWAVRVGWGRSASALSLPALVIAYSRPLHLVAAGIGGLLLAGGLAAVLHSCARTRRWAPALAVLLLGLMAFLPAEGGHDEDGLGFRSRWEDQREREARGLHDASTLEDLLMSRPEFFPAARWRGAALLLLAGTLAGAGFGLVRGRLARARTMAVLSLLAMGAAALWGICGVLRVEQARIWASRSTLPALIDAAFHEAAVPPLVAFWVAAALFTLALRRGLGVAGEKDAAAVAPVQNPLP